SVVPPALALGRQTFLVVDVLVVAAHVGERGGEEPIHRRAIERASHRDAVQGSNLILGSGNRADGRVLGARARLVLVDVLLRELEAQGCMLPGHRNVDRTLLRPAACTGESCAGDRVERRDRETKGKDAPSHGVTLHGNEQRTRTAGEAWRLRARRFFSRSEREGGWSMWAEGRPPRSKEIRA